jgi:hypothetical protein
MILKGKYHEAIECGVLFWRREGQISNCNFWLAPKKYSGAELRKMTEYLY